MKSKKEIDKEFEDIDKVLAAWNERLDNPSKYPSFESKNYEELLAKSLLVGRSESMPEIQGVTISYDRMTIADIAISILAGGIGAVIPKLSHDFLDHIHEEYSNVNGLLGKIFNHQGEWIDTHIINETKRVVKGPFHRFRPDGMHDPINLSGLFTSWKQFGVIKGTVKYIIHLSLDSFSQTGLPVPGTSNFLFWIRETFGMKLFGLKDQSAFAGIRMADILQAGATQGIISMYMHLLDVPKDSLRRPQLGIRAHGISIVGSTYIACSTQNVNMLSKISYPACILFAKNCWTFYKNLNNITKESEAMNIEINRLVEMTPNLEII